MCYTRPSSFPAHLPAAAPSCGSLLHLPKHSARGISAESARQALVFSFGAEVIQRMGHPVLQKRVQDDVSRTLLSAEPFAASA